MAQLTVPRTSHTWNTTRDDEDPDPVYTRNVVIFFEALLVLASILIAWFSIYVVYRLVTDES